MIFLKKGVTSPFAETVFSVEAGDLAIDDAATGRSVPLDYFFVPNFNIAEREGEECVRRALEKLSGEMSARAEPACAVDAHEESEVAFVDVVGDGRGDEGTESEGFTLETP